MLDRWGGLRASVLLLALFVGACSEDDQTATADASASSAPSLGARAPTISGSPVTSIAANTAYTFQPSAADADGDALTFTINAKPSWMTFDRSTGRLTGTPSAADVGVYRNIVVSVSDGRTAVSLPAFDVTVTGIPAANQAPTISGTPPEAVLAGEEYSFAPTAADPDGDALTFTILNRPPWASFTEQDGLLSGTPEPGDAGTYTGIVITVSDGDTEAALEPFDLTVDVPHVNSPPAISGSPPPAVAAGTPYVFVPTAVDPDDDALVFGITGLPAWASFDATTGRLAGTPPTGAVGATGPIVIAVSDGQATSALPAFSITVTAPSTNVPPTISGVPPGSATVGVAYSFQPTAADADGDALSFTIANRPSWASFDPATGRLQGTPGNNHVRRYWNIVIAVSDGEATTALQGFSITVASTNEAPTISGTPGTAAETGQQYSFQPTANDEDGDSLSFSITNKPAWANFSTSTGRLWGTPSSTGTFANIVIRVSDGEDTAQLQAFTISVTQANRAPTISGTPAASVEVDEQYSFQPTANDADGDSLSFSVSNKPAWANFSASTGRLWGTPSSAGTFSGIVIRVTDDEETAQLQAFTITVTEPNRAPTISGTPDTAAATGEQYSFRPTADDEDDDSLTFSVTNRPAWANFSTSTGRLWGTPSSAGTFQNIVIRVSDGTATAQLEPFTITVTQENRAPTISGTPSTQVVQGTEYAFTPTAADPDGDSLTFSITNKPEWADFDPSTGALTGTPGPSHIGTTTGIVIRVTDGEATTALATFSVTVQSVAFGSATLSWTPPVSNEDGSALTDLAGYRVYWGTTQGNYTSSRSIDSPGVSNYMIENLVPGTYYFVITAVNTAGAESSFSNVASKTIQ